MRNKKATFTNLDEMIRCREYDYFRYDKLGNDHSRLNTVAPKKARNSEPKNKSGWLATCRITVQ